LSKGDVNVLELSNSSALASQPNPVPPHDNPNASKLLPGSARAASSLHASKSPPSHDSASGYSGLVGSSWSSVTFCPPNVVPLDSDVPIDEEMLTLESIVEVVNRSTSSTSATIHT